MARHVPPPFSQGSIEEIAKIVGDLYSGSELTRILVQVGLPDPLGSAMTKWKRLAAAMQEKQASKHDGGAVVGLIHAAMHLTARSAAALRQLSLATTSTKFYPSPATASRMTVVSPRRLARPPTAKQRPEAKGCTSYFLTAAHTETSCCIAAPNWCGPISTRRYSSRSKDSGTGSAR